MHFHSVMKTYYKQISFFSHFHKQAQKIRNIHFLCVEINRVRAANFTFKFKDFSRTFKVQKKLFSSTLHMTKNKQTYSVTVLSMYKITAHKFIMELKQFSWHYQEVFFFHYMKKNNKYNTFIDDWDDSDSAALVEGLQKLDIVMFVRCVCRKLWSWCWCFLSFSMTSQSRLTHTWNVKTVTDTPGTSHV